jgi:hypothetical protein
MKKKIFILTCLLIGLQWSMVAQTKRALLVAISTYAPGTDWKTIHTEYDVEVARTALLAQGFLPSNIHVLQNELATKANILLNMEQLLYEQAKSGDLIYFHFSGHGQQMIDKDGDELDRLDECMVPYDAPKNFVKGVYEGDRHFRDDEWAAICQKIRKKIGPKGQMIAVIDACHSGTILRNNGGEGVRGTVTVMAPSDFVKEVRVGGAEEELLEKVDLDKLGSIVGFFGCKASQLNYECVVDGKKMGSLSYSFYKHFSKAGSQTTYRGLFDQVRAEMQVQAPRQTPSAEGNLDFKVLDGTAKGGHPFYKVTDRKGTDWVLAGGELHGLTKGSIVGFFEEETAHPTKETSRYTAEIKTSDFLTATVRRCNTSDGEQYYIYLLEQKPGEMRVTVRNALGNNRLSRTVIDSLQKEIGITVTPNGSCSLEENYQGDSILVFGSSDRQLGAFKAAPGVHTRIAEVLKRHARAEYLRKLTIASSSRGEELFPDFQIEIVPLVTKYGKIMERLSIDQFRTPDGSISIPEGMSFKLRVRNPGLQSGYFHLLNIPSNDSIQLLIPKAGDATSSIESYYFKGGIEEVKELPEGRDYWTFSGSPGLETFQLWVTEQPIDLRSVLVNRGKKDKDKPFSEVELLLASSFFPDASVLRSANNQRFSSNRFGVYRLGYQLTKWQ